MSTIHFFRKTGLLTLVLFCVTSLTDSLSDSLFAQGVIPGTGRKVTRVGDDFEELNWEFIHNFPKSSSNIDHQGRFPLGFSRNGRVSESGYRGQPDVLKRVATPAGGIPGSKGALLMQTLQTGIPGMISRESQQDDLLMNISSIVGNIPVAFNPNFTVRVYVPPFEKWDPQSNTSLGIRGALFTTLHETKAVGFFRRQQTISKREEYWPGFFLQLQSKTDPRFKEDSAIVLIRANQNGQDYFGRKLDQTGWWTFGMSFTPDGQGALLCQSRC